MKLILSAGTFRSASTLQFNILRVILEQAYGDIYSCFIPDYKPSNKSEVHLIKIHVPDDKLLEKADYVFTSIRDKKGMVQSIERRAKIDDPCLKPEMIDNYIACFTYWALDADFVQNYKMIENMDLLISNYIKILRVGVSVGGVKKQLKKEMVEPDKDHPHHDKKTLLHYKHKK